MIYLCRFGERGEGLIAIKTTYPSPRSGAAESGAKKCPRDKADAPRTFHSA
jgi:hypothetical protein